MSKNLLIIGVIVLLLVVGAIAMTRNDSNNLDLNLSGLEGATSTNDSPATTTATTTTATSTQTSGNVREFVVTGSAFKFDPASIRVNEGDTVRITFKNAQGTHDWVLDEFNARTKVIGAGQQESITFVADRKGSFEYYCSVGNHRAQGMRGTFIVE